MIGWRGRGGPCGGVPRTKLMWVSKWVSKSIYSVNHCGHLRMAPKTNQKKKEKRKIGKVSVVWSRTGERRWGLGVGGGGGRGDRREVIILNIIEREWIWEKSETVKDLLQLVCTSCSACRACAKYMFILKTNGNELPPVTRHHVISTPRYRKCHSHTIPADI